MKISWNMGMFSSSTALSIAGFFSALANILNIRSTGSGFENVENEVAEACGNATQTLLTYLETTQSKCNANADDTTAYAIYDMVAFGLVGACCSYSAYKCYQKDNPSTTPTPKDPLEEFESPPFNPDESLIVGDPSVVAPADPAIVVHVKVKP